MKKQAATGRPTDEWLAHPLVKRDKTLVEIITTLRETDKFEKLCATKDGRKVLSFYFGYLSGAFLNTLNKLALSEKAHREMNVLLKKATTKH